MYIPVENAANGNASLLADCRSFLDSLGKSKKAIMVQARKVAQHFQDT